jgi:hypothetical protein
VRIAPDRGELQRRRCLEALALFQDDPTRVSAVPAERFLDVRNVMWLMAAMLFVRGPAPAAPAALGGRLLRSGGRLARMDRVVALRIPPRLLVAAITIAAAVGTFLQYGRITGREAG